MTTDDLEYLGKINPRRLTSLVEDSKKEQAQIHADQERWTKYGTNDPRKVALSKREIMEEMTRERFPWEE
jgi:hypothetical protein